MSRDALLLENEELRQSLAEKERELSMQASLLAEKNALIRELSNKVSLLEILHFGPKSEKWTKQDETQAFLFNEAEDETFKQCDPDQMNAVIETIELGPHTRRKRKPQGQGRKPISPDLPREEIIYDIDDADKICACGTEKTNIGSETSERVVIIPAVMKVIRETKLKYACKNCEGTEADEPGVVTAEGPRHLLAGSIADESLLAWSISEKYEFALPLYRQTKRLEYIGLPVTRATLSNWAVKTAFKCKVLYELLKDYIKSFRFINADETRVQVLKEKGRRAQSLSWMWVFLGGPPGKKAVIFQYNTTRSSAVPKKFLNDYTGWLQTDDYSGYATALKELNEGSPLDKIIRHILCWQHARSYFHKSLKVEKSEHAQEAIDFIGKLFALEDLRDESSERGFFRQRKKHAKLIFKKFKRWLMNLYPQTLPGSLLGKAIRYTLDNWDLLIL
jgi:transposase